MPDYLDDHEDDSDLVRQLRKQLRDKTSKLTEAEAAKSAAEGRFTERLLADTLTAKGVNPKAAKFLRADGVDATDETAVTKWLDENSDLFPASTQAAEPAPTEPTVDPEVVQGYGQMNLAHQLQRPADINRLTEAERELPANATPEQVAAHFRAKGL